MDKIAAEAAREVFGIMHEICFTEYQLAKIIESALSQSLAARDKEIEELIAEWRRWEDTHCYSGTFADQLEALLKGKAI